MSQVFLELKDFKNVHILNKVLKNEPYIYYPVSKDNNKNYSLNCVKYYFEPEINLWKFEFKNRILYTSDNIKTVIRKMNDRLRKRHGKYLELFDRLNDEMRNYKGNFDDDEYDILQKRYETAKNMILDYNLLTEPFKQVINLSLDLDKILNNNRKQQQ